MSSEHLKDNIGDYIKIYLASPEEAAAHCGFELTPDQMEEFQHAVDKGIHANLDWDIIYSCASDCVSAPDPCSTYKIESTVNCMLRDEQREPAPPREYNRNETLRKLVE